MNFQTLQTFNSAVRWDAPSGDRGCVGTPFDSLSVSNEFEKLKEVV